MKKGNADKKTQTQSSDGARHRSAASDKTASSDAKARDARNFKVRWICGVAMFVVALVGMYTFDGVPFKVIYGLFAVMSGIELLSFFHKKFAISNAVMVLIELALLTCSAVWMAQVGAREVWYIILGVCGYDIFAYLCGRAIGGKIFKKSRPFPFVSKNKTWEGTALGLLISMLLVSLYITVQGDWNTEWYYLCCGILALVGDLWESFLKRRFDVKDSNEIVLHNPVFSKLEYLVGGSAGHGGFLDRIDSTAFAATVLLIVSIIF